MKAMRRAPGAERKAPEIKPQRRAGASLNSRVKGEKTKSRGPEASRLIALADLRPLTGGPEGRKRKKCPDCRYCQGCSQDRCRLCRAGRKPARVKLSQAEQLALFEKINRPKRRKPPGLGRQ